MGEVDAVDRIYQGGAETRLPPWRCPACGVEQAGPLEQGCGSCGSGKPGYHVGVPPKGSASSTATSALPLTARPLVGNPIEVWFNEWFERKGKDMGNPNALEQIRPILLEAWTAGIRHYQEELAKRRPEVQAPTPEPLAGVTLDPSLVPIPRAVLKRVIEVLEGVTDLPEDQQSPELLALIAQLKEVQES